ncbi:MAG: methyltransferase, partial [Euryarchaeota archaeon]|nr:methyltransferase [Euryarchaeota archaeon]
MTRDLAERRGVETTVYGAAADSQLLVDAAVETVEAVEKPLMALDCGTGSGYVGGKLAEVDARVIASDLNPHACA